MYRIELQRARHLELGDFTTFEILPHAASPTIDDVFDHAQRFLNPVLANVEGTWNPEIWSWVEMTA